MPEAKSTTQEAADVLVQQLLELSEGIDRPVAVMEVCGTHTVTVRQSGLHELLPKTVRLISGPGCPVCITGTGGKVSVVYSVHEALAYAREHPEEQIVFLGIDHHALQILEDVFGFSPTSWRGLGIIQESGFN